MKWRDLRYKIGCYFLSLEKKIKLPKKGADLIYKPYIYVCIFSKANNIKNMCNVE